jgi:hypothetical protein
LLGSGILTTLVQLAQHGLCLLPLSFVIGFKAPRQCLGVCKARVQENAIVKSLLALSPRSARLLVNSPLHSLAPLILMLKLRLAQMTLLIDAFVLGPALAARKISSVLAVFRQHRRGLS